MATEPLQFPVSAPGSNQVAAGFLGIRTQLGGIKAALAGLGLFTFFRQAITLSRDFEFEMAQVQAITGATTEEFERLNKVARDLGATTIFTAREAASGLIELGRAGFDATESVQAIPEALLLAEAGNLSLGRSTQILTGAIRAYNLDASKAAQVSDLIVTVANKSKTDVEGLGRAFSFTAAAASAAGISMQEMTAVIGAVAQAGIPVQRAGRGIANVFSILATESDKVETAMQRVGLTARDVNPEFNSFETIVERLALAFPNLSTAAGAFDRVAARAVVALVGQRDLFKELIVEQNRAAGATQKFSDRVRNTLRGDFKTLNSVFQEFLLQLGDAGLVDITRKATQGLSKFLVVVTGKTDGFITNMKLSTEEVNKQIDEFALYRTGLIVTGRVVATVARTYGVFGQSIVDTTQAAGHLAATLALLATGQFSAAKLAAEGAVDSFKETTEALEGIFDELSESPSLRKIYEGIRAEQRQLRMEAEKAAETNKNDNGTLRNKVNFLDQVASAWERVTQALEKYGGRLDAIQDVANSIVNSLSQLTTHGLTIERAQRDQALFNRELEDNTRRIRELQAELRGASDETRIQQLETRIDNLTRRNFELQRQLNESAFAVSTAGNQRTRSLIGGFSDLFSAGTGLVSAFGSSGNTFHSGGFVGSGGRNVPIIAQQGEAVFTPRQLENAENLFRNQGGVQVQVIDQRTPDAAPPVIQTDRRGNIQVFLTKVVSSVIRSGAVDDYLSTRFGARRRA